VAQVILQLVGRERLEFLPQAHALAQRFEQR
jgi:hypothetical protein